LIITIVGSFNAAADIKDAAATSKWGRSDFAFVISDDDALSQLGDRMDLGPPFWQSSAYISAIETPGSLSWSNQLVALIPRVFWPDKPVMDYGQRVTSEIYALRDVQSSSTISTLGDVNLNSGPYGVLVIGIVIGIACFYV